MHSASVGSFPQPMTVLYGGFDLEGMATDEIWLQDLSTVSVPDSDCVNCGWLVNITLDITVAQLQEVVCIPESAHFQTALADALNQTDPSDVHYELAGIPDELLQNGGLCLFTCEGDGLAGSYWSPSVNQEAVVEQNVTCDQATGTTPSGYPCVTIGHIPLDDLPTANSTTNRTKPWARQRATGPTLGPALGAGHRNLTSATAKPIGNNSTLRVSVLVSVTQPYHLFGALSAKGLMNISVGGASLGLKASVMGSPSMSLINCYEATKSSLFPSDQLADFLSACLPTREVRLDMRQLDYSSHCTSRCALSFCQFRNQSNTNSARGNFRCFAPGACAGDGVCGLPGSRTGHSSTTFTYQVLYSGSESLSYSPCTLRLV